MSHFVTLVIGDNIERQLKPYEETDHGPYVVFKDTEADLRKSYENDDTNCFVEPNGTVHQACSDEFRNPDAFACDRYLCPAGWTEQRVTVKQVYKTWESYLTDYCGEEPDEDTGKLGYWHNPNARWDWYAVGGRWSDRLMLKDGTKANQARYGDIDWNAMVAKHAEFYASVYDYVWPKIKDTPSNIPWSDFYDRYDRGELTVEKAREEFSVQPRVKIAEELREIVSSNRVTNDDISGWISWNLVEETHEFTDDKAMFVKTKAEEALRTFAVVKDGRWFERGKMGWFAAVHDEKDPETWASVWDSLVRNVSPDTLITIVDCHI